MLRAALGLALAIGFAVNVPAVRAGDVPKGPPPRVMATQVDKDGRAYLTAFTTEFRKEKRTYVEVVNGRQENREKIVTIPIAREVQVYLDDAGVEVFGTDGKRVDAKHVKFRAPIGVFVSADGRPVDPFYLRLARPGTLVVVGRTLVDPLNCLTPPPPPKDGPRPD